VTGAALLGRQPSRCGRYVLGGAIRVPAVFLEAVLIGGMTTSIGLAQDLHSGIIDRFRSLPMARSAVLAGRTLADISRSLVSLAIMIGLGLLVGFRFHNDAGSIIAGILLIIAFGYAFSWVYAAIGIATKDPETAQVAGILPFFILMFASNAIVPVSTMPSWLKASPATSHSASRSPPSAPYSKAAPPDTGSGNHWRGQPDVRRAGGHIWLGRAR
jgi:ABC transporter DrrB family efflux protein